MREETKTVKIYNYSELSEKAKEKVKQMFLDRKPEYSYIFTEDCEEDLKSLFPNSNLKIEYSLNYCQGDGFNIYGDLDIEDILEYLDFKDDEKEKIKNICVDSDYIVLRRNTSRYSYSVKFSEDAEDVINNLNSDYDNLSENNRKLLKHFIEKSLNYTEKLDKYFEKAGYNFFYETNEEEVKEGCEDNGYEFTEDGELYFNVSRETLKEEALRK